MVTKRQQLEFAAKHIERWKSGYDFAVVEETIDGHLYVRWPSICTSGITKKEWQQERDKMQKQPVQPAQPAPDNAWHEHKITNQEIKRERDKMSSKPEVDNSWHERGELPPVGVPVELWWGGSFAYNCEFITRRGHHYVMWNLDADRPDAADYMNSQFRPLRTERDKAIDEMALLAIGCEKYAITQNAAKAVCELLYDSGYHR